MILLVLGVEKDCRLLTSGANLAYSSIQLCNTLSGQTTKKGRELSRSRKYALKAIVWRVCWCKTLVILRGSYEFRTKPFPVPSRQLE